MDTIVTYAKTKSGTLEYCIDISKTFPTRVADFADKQRFDALCKSGCINYGHKWSCPPFAPSFLDFVVDWESLLVLFLRLDVDQLSYIKNDYLKIKAANSVLKSRADRFLRLMAEKYGKYISTGSCRLCKPCERKLNMPCVHPGEMAYSFEALGINVSALVDNYFAKSLLWYTNRCIPQYTSVVCGLLTNDSISPKALLDEYQKVQ